MCGIAGFVDFNGSKIDISLLKQATDSISHRGPDGEGHWIEDNIGIGHRRLSIIDLSTMYLNQWSVKIKDTFYLTTVKYIIFKELRTELENKMYHFIANQTLKLY